MHHCTTRQCARGTTLRWKPHANAERKMNILPAVCMYNSRLHTRHSRVPSFQFSFLQILLPFFALYCTGEYAQIVVRSPCKLSPSRRAIFRSLSHSTRPLHSTLVYTTSSTLLWSIDGSLRAFYTVVFARRARPLLHDNSDRSNADIKKGFRPSLPVTLSNQFHLWHLEAGGFSFIYRFQPAQ